MRNTPLPGSRQGFRARRVLQRLPSNCGEMVVAGFEAAQRLGVAFELPEANADDANDHDDHHSSANFLLP